MTEKPQSKRAVWGVSLFLVASTVVAYWPVRQAAFINYDDMDYVFQNLPVQQGLTPRGIAWAFTGTRSANWHPVTWLSHMLDCQLWGLAPHWHHLTNLFLHAANSLLLFIVFTRLSRSLWHSAFIAGLFALHPLHVESVAWISERKDLLSTLFFILTLWTYVGYTRAKNQKPGLPARKVAGWYTLSLILFALGLMSKPMLVTLPCVLLLLDYWPLQRITQGGMERDRSQPWRSLLSNALPLVREKVPFFSLSLISSVVTFLVQRSAGAVSALEALPLSDRLGNAAVAYWSYLQKTLWPLHLSIYYPHPGHWPAARVFGAVVALLGISAIACLPWGKRRYLCTGWFWFLGTLVPVIGIVQVGSQSMADRYTYIPSIGLFIVAAWGAGSLFPRSRLAIAIKSAVALSLLVAAGSLTWIQAGYWQNSEKLFSHALRVTEANYLAHFSLGNALIDQGDIDRGRSHLERAAELNPEAPLVQGALACLEVKERQFPEAVSHYGEAIRLEPGCAEALNNLAWLLATCPEPSVRNGAQAVVLAEKACDLTHFERTLFVGTLAAAYAEAGRFTEAVAMAERASQVGAIWQETALIKRNQELAELYRAGKPYHENR